MSFYSVGKEFPNGWLVTANGENLITASGEPIITESTRERIESMWDSDINVQGESTMDIVPPLRKVSVGVKNKMITNIFEQIDIYNITKWYNPDKFLSLQGENRLRFSGDSDKQGVVVYYRGYDIQQCSYQLKLEYTFKVFISRYSAIGGIARPPTDKTLNIEYGFKIVGADKTMWLTDEGLWTADETYLKDGVQLSVDVNKEIEVKGFPCSGKFIFFIKQTLAGYTVGRNSCQESLYISDLRMEMDTGDDYEDSLNYQTISNPANNVDMSVDLPIADIPNIPNDKLIYSLYFTDQNNRPTRMWHSKGGNDYNSLVNHIVACALKYRQRPARRIGGEIFTGKHIDMNTVVQDDKYLRSGFYVNSIELNCLNDSYNSELVETPGLFSKEIPPEGDDCIKLIDLPFKVKKAIRCVNKIILQSTTNYIYSYDTVSGYLTRLFTYTSTAKLDIFPADNSFTVVDSASVRVVDYRGIVIKKHDLRLMRVGNCFRKTDRKRQYRQCNSIRQCLHCNQKFGQKQIAV